MKSAFALTGLIATQIVFADHNAHKQFAQVTRVDPVYEEVAFEEPREYCWDETVYYEQRKNSAAPLLGAIIGGVIGHNVGHGSSNKKMGAFVGAGVGAAIGSHSARDDGHYHVERRCETVYDRHWKKELVGYDVTYRYHGVEYQTRLPEHPGKKLRVNVTVTPAS